MRNYGLEIDRPIVPTDIKLDESPDALASLDGHPVQVRTPFVLDSFCLSEFGPLSGHSEAPHG